MTWLWARIRCRWSGHMWRLMTADLQFSSCLRCAKQGHTGYWERTWYGELAKLEAADG